MTVFLQILIFALGLVLLVKGADFLVSGSVSLAKRLRVPDIVIGLTIVAFGTSAPELIVSLFAALSGNTDIAVGNVVGSNTANILLILGVSALVYPLTVKSATVWKEIPFAFLAAILLCVLGLDVFVSGEGVSVLSRGDGLALLGVFCIFMYYILGAAQKGDSAVAPEELAVIPVWKTTLFIIGGLVGLALGGYWMVESATILATMAGISQQIIGLTIVAVGTSLPELATSIMAAVKKQSDIAIGNVVGSNLFNILWILGMTATITPLPLQQGLMPDIVVMLVSTMLLFAVLFIGKRHLLERWQGGVFVLLYGAYTVSLIVR